MLSRWTRLLASALVAVILAGIAPSVLSADDEEIRKKFWEGIKAYNGGDFAAARTNFEEALAQGPSPDLAAALRDEVGEKCLAEMYAQGGEMRDTAMKILKMAKGVYDKVKHSPDEIDGVVSKLDAPGFDDWWVASNKVISIGQYAAPNLVAVLGNQQNDNWRAKAIVTLEKMGDQAVLPLAAAMSSPNPLVRKNAAMTLGTIGDGRALPALRRAVEDPAETGEVKSSAAEAIAKISKANPNCCPSSKELYVELAERFYQDDPTVMGGAYPDPLVFSMNGDKLALAEVPGWALNESLAIQAGHAALALDQHYYRAYPVLISAYYQLSIEAKTALDVAEKALAAGEGGQEDVDKAKAALGEAEKGKLFGPMSGKANMYAALTKALKEKNGAVGEAIINDLAPYVSEDDLPQAQCGPQACIGTPLIQALIDDDTRVRYAAAIAIAALNPTSDFLGAGQVARNLADAVSQQGVWLVLVADQDPEVRNRMRAILSKLNCHVIDADGPMDALKRAKAFPSADLIVLGAKAISHIVFGVPKFSEPGTNYTESVYDGLKADLRTKGIPIFLLADDADPEKGAFADKVQAILSRTPDEAGVKAALVAVFETEEMKKSSKSRAEAVAQRSAEMLAKLNPRGTSVPVCTAVPSLCEALTGRTDLVGIPSANALGRIGDPCSIGALVRAYSDRDRSKEFRIACAMGAGKVFKATGEAPSCEVYLALKAAVMTEGDVDIARAAAAALGWSDLSDEQRRELFEARRLVR